jgi:hypothetical protein
MASEDATAELRKSAGHQLDTELVESFITLLEREGPKFGQGADYETELAFDQRVNKMARSPRSGGGEGGLRSLRRFRRAHARN